MAKKGIYSTVGCGGGEGKADKNIESGGAGRRNSYPDPLLPFLHTSYRSVSQKEPDERVK